MRGIVGACTKTIDPPDPKVETCRKIPEGIGKGIVFCADTSGSWDTDNPSVYKSLNSGIEQIISCMEEKLDANIAITVEPGIISPLPFEMGIQSMMMAKATDKFYKESEVDLYPDEFPFEEYCEIEPDDEACAVSSQIGEKVYGGNLSATIPAEFAVILIDKDACVVEKDVWGVTLTDENGNTRIWINRIGQLWQHELTHLFAGLMGLTQQEAGSLEDCTPEINHHKL